MCKQPTRSLECNAAPRVIYAGALFRARHLHATMYKGHSTASHGPLDAHALRATRAALATNPTNRRVRRPHARRPRARRLRRDRRRHRHRRRCIPVSVLWLHRVVRQRAELFCNSEQLRNLHNLHNVHRALCDLLANVERPIDRHKTEHTKKNILALCCYKPA